MIKKLLKTAIYTAAFAVLAVNGPEMHEDWLVLSLADSVVKLTPVGIDDRGGTGYQIQTEKGAMILTNAHVCEGVGGVYASAHYAGGSRQQVVRVARMDDITDLCLLSPVSGLDAMSLSDAGPEIGDTIASVGHPLLAPQTFSKGRVIGYEMVQIVTGFIQPDAANGGCEGAGGRPEFIFCVRPYSALLTSMTIFPGNSGSPVVNFWGDVVGIVFASNTRSNHGIIIPVEEIHRFIREAL